MKTKQLIAALAVSMTLVFSGAVFSEQTNLEKAKVMKNEAVNTAKKKFRNAKNELCEYVEGKLQCIADKVENKVRDMKDDAKAKKSEMQDKLD